MVGATIATTEVMRQATYAREEDLAQLQGGWDDSDDEDTTPSALSRCLLTTEIDS